MSSPPSLAAAEVRPGARFGPPDDEFEIEQELGSGAASRVFGCRHLATGERLAVKAVDLRRLLLLGNLKDQLARLDGEVEILRQLCHERIVNLRGFHKSEHWYFLVMELVDGGELFDLIVRSKSLSEAEARHVFRQLLEGVGYMHARGVLHRDLKPENILVASSRPAPTSEEGQLYDVKIVDFGLSKAIGGGASLARTRVGTPQYWAPEVLDVQRRGGSYDQAADFWGLGAILFVMLCGRYPFDGQKAPLEDQIRTASYSMTGPRWRQTSEVAKSFVRGLLRVNPVDRLSLEDCLRHPWVTGEPLPKPQGLQPRLPPVQHKRPETVPEDALCQAQEEARLRHEQVLQMKRLQQLQLKQMHEAQQQKDVPQQQLQQLPEEAPGEEDMSEDQLEDNRAPSTSCCTVSEDGGARSRSVSSLGPISERHLSTEQAGRTSSSSSVKETQPRGASSQREVCSAKKADLSSFPCWSFLFRASAFAALILALLGTPNLGSSSTRREGRDELVVNSLLNTTDRQMPQQHQLMVTTPSPSFGHPSTSPPSLSLQPLSDPSVGSTVNRLQQAPSTLQLSAGTPSAGDGCEEQETIFQLSELLKLQVSISGSLEMACIAFRHADSELAEATRLTFEAARDLFKQAASVVARYAEVASQVSRIVLPDLQLAVEEQEPALAVSLLDTVKSWVSDMKSDGEAMRVHYGELQSTVLGLAQRAQRTKQAADIRLAEAIRHATNEETREQNRLRHRADSTRPSDEDISDSRIEVPVSSSATSGIKICHSSLSPTSPSPSPQPSATVKSSVESSPSLPDGSFSPALHLTSLTQRLFEQLSQLSGQSNSSATAATNDALVAVAGSAKGSGLGTSPGEVEAWQKSVIDLLFLAPGIVPAGPQKVEKQNFTAALGFPTKGSSNSRALTAIDSLHLGLQRFATPPPTSTLADEDSPDISTDLKVWEEEDAENVEGFDRGDASLVNSTENTLAVVRYIEAQDARAAAEKAARSSASLLRALRELRRVDTILEGCFVFWANMDGTVQKLAQMKEHTQKLVSYASTKPKLRQRFEHRLKEYASFWTALEQLCRQYSTNHQIATSNMQDFLRDVSNAADLVDTAESARAGERAGQRAAAAAGRAVSDLRARRSSTGGRGQVPDVQVATVLAAVAGTDA